MNRFIKSVGMLAVSFSVIAMIGCAGTKKPIETGEADEAVISNPKPIESLIEKKYSQSIHAVGQASALDKVTAVKKARLDAQQQIADVFRNDISNLQKSFLEAVNKEQLEEYRNTVESFTNITLTGVSEAKSMLSKGKDGYTAYVLMTVSAETIKNLIDEKTNALTNFKALAAYKELEDRVAKDNAARAQPDAE
jgi:hypothetical protein